MDPIVLLGALLALLAAIWFVFVRRGGRRSCVVLYGPMGSGKTALYHRLKTGDFVATVTSMKENEATFDWQGCERRGQHTVDIPGHGRLRWRVKDFVPICKALLIVVDSTALGNVANARDAANCVWDAIHVKPAGAKIIIVCNKSDDILAVSCKRVRVLLEAQLSALARTRSRYPGFHGDDEEGEAAAVDETVAGAGENFNFDTSSPVPVTFVATSVKRGDLKQLNAALENI